MRTIIAALCCLLAAGCSSTPTTSGGGKSAKANFEKVKDGMSDKEVADLLGSPTSSVEMDPKKAQAMMKDLMKGVQLPELPPIPLPNMPVPKMTVKNWEDGDTIYQVVFQDNKVAGKEAVSKKSKVTKENADSIKIDMTKAEVEAILGKGKASAGAKVEGFSGETVVWEGEAGAISVGFINDKVKIAGSFEAKK